MKIFRVSLYFLYSTATTNNELKLKIRLFDLIDDLDIYLTDLEEVASGLDLLRATFLLPTKVYETGAVLCYSFLICFDVEPVIGAQSRFASIRACRTLIVEIPTTSHRVVSRLGYGNEFDGTRII